MADSSTAIHICNLALLSLGEARIASLDEGTPNAILCHELYPGVRDALLSWQSWPFATVRQTLARLVAVPLSDYGYYYALPTIPTVLRIIDIDLAGFEYGYQREIYVNPADPNDQTAVIATRALSVVLRYVGRTAEGLWPPLCVEAMGLWLAARMAPKITGKQSLRGTLLQELGFDGAGRVQGGLLGKLRDIAGHEDTPRAIPMPDDYLHARGNHASSAPTRYSDHW